MTRRPLMLALALGVAGCAQQDPWSERPLNDGVTVAFPCADAGVKLERDEVTFGYKCAKQGAGLFIATRGTNGAGRNLNEHDAYYLLKAAYDASDKQTKTARTWLNANGPLESEWVADDIRVRQRVVLVDHIFYRLEVWGGRGPLTPLEQEFFNRAKLRAN